MSSVVVKKMPPSISTPPGKSMPKSRLKKEQGNQALWDDKWKYFYPED